MGIKARRGIQEHSSWENLERTKLDRVSSLICASKSAYVTSFSSCVVDVVLVSMDNANGTQRRRRDEFQRQLMHQ